MLPLTYIREHTEAVRAGVRGKGEEVDLDRILALDKRLRAGLTEAESLKAERNRVSREIAALKRKGAPSEENILAMRSLGVQIKSHDKEITALRGELDERLLWVPNLPHESVPAGRTPAENRVVATYGEPAPFAFSPRDHVALMKQLDLVDMERGGRIAGRGFPLYTRRGARLERALINFMLDLHTRQHGYAEIYPPFLASRKSTEVTGQLPKLADDMYLATGDDLFLIPTAEVSVTNIHQGEVLAEEALPIKYVAFSACFRREAGSYGQETRGLLRVHQFNKVELVKFVHPDSSYGELETLRADAEKVLQLLGLTYRVVELCAGDLSFAASKCYDLEVYAPVEGKWLEVSSCSNFEAFQARRGRISFRRRESGRLESVHTLNGSGLATPRLTVALLESCQQSDGSIEIPEVLIPYYGESRIDA